MGPFASALAGFKHTVETRSAAVFVGSVVALRDSVKYGSAETGAPAMPVAPNEFPRAGALRDSVIAVYPTPHTALVYTDKVYAPDVETNTKGHTFHIGGPHGWALTIHAGVRVIENVAKRIAGYG